MKKFLRFHTVCIIALLFFSGPPEAAASQAPSPAMPVIGNVRVEVTDGPFQRREKLAELARKIIRVKPGERFSHDALVLSLDLLKQTGQFSTIHVPDQDWDAPKVDLQFSLTPVTLVREILVDGAFPVFTDEVIRATDYVAGRAYAPDSLEKNRTAVKTLFTENGYIDPEVRITPIPLEDLTVSVHIDIQKQAYLKNAAVVFNGNHAFSDTRLRMMMKSAGLSLFFWRGGKRAVAKDLEKDVKKLLAFYRKKGFADAAVTQRIEPLQEENDRAIVIDIEEGPQYRVSFSGNQAFSTYILKKDLILKTKGNRNDFGLKKSVKNLENRYRAAGFPDCKIDYTATPVIDGGREYRDVGFHITENTRYLVRSSDIQGAQAIAPDTLKADILTRGKDLLDSGAYVKQTVEEDARALSELYSAKGYAGTKVKPDVAWQKGEEDGVKYADIIFQVSEGRQRTIGDVTLNGISPDVETEIRPRLKTRAGTPFIRSHVKEDRQAILSFLAEKGYIYAKADAHVIKEGDGKTVAIDFRIDTKQKAVAGGVWTFGNLRTRDSVLLRHNTIHGGDTVSLDKFVALQKNIRNLNCIERANFKVLGAQENQDELFFIADVEEKKSYYLETGLGYDTARDAYITASVGDRNFMGLNRKLYLDGEFSGIGYETTLGLREHDFLSQQILADLTLYASEEEQKNHTFGSRQYGTEFAFEKELTDRLKTGAGTGLEFREQYAVESTPDDDPDVYDMRGIVSFTPFITWDSVDSFVKPTKGFYLNASAGYHRDILEDLDHFIKYRFKAKYYYQPLPRLVLAFQGMAGYIHNFSGDAGLPDDQLFFLGGISDVRGYDENELKKDTFGDPAGGKTQVSGSIEARIDLGRNFELPIFFDAGTIQDSTASGVSEGFEFTVGSGIRYMTPVGPVGLLYGYKISPDDGEDSGRLHFSVGYTF